MSDIKVTLEALYDILRNEKKKEDLQQLDSSFFVDVVAYLRGKKALLEAKSDQDELFASTEKDKLEYELRSIKRILKEIYEKREKKIIDIAMNKSRTRSDIIDTTAMLREEKEFYNLIVSLLDKYRSGVLLNLFKGHLPFVNDELKAATVVQESPAKKEVAETEEKTSEKSTFNKFENVDAPAPDTVNEDDAEEDMPEESETSELTATQEQSDEQEETTKEDKETEKEETAEQDKSDFTKIRFIHPVPRFVWKDMKEYGPFSTGDETEIFPEVADLMVRKGRAEKV
jgi:DNA replication initiation complex subunit (GINS family)